MSLSTTTVFGNFVCDASGTNIANARISWQPVSSVTRTPISFCIGGGGQVSDQPVSTNVTNGSFSLTLADTSQTVPVNIGYKVTVVDNVSGRTLISYPCVQPTGASWDFDLYQPSFPTATTTNPGTGGGGGALFSQVLTFGGPGTQTVTHGLNSAGLIVQGVITGGKPTRWWATVLDANSLSVTTLGAMVLDVIVMGGSASSSSNPGNPGNPGNPSNPVAPAITQQPSGANPISVSNGTTVTMTAAASGSPTPSVQWFTDNGSSGATWTAISGATSASYSFTATTAHTGWKYKATFTNSAGSATTTVATVTVTAALPNPVASWPMTEGSGHFFIDSVAGNNFDITAVNWGSWLGVDNTNLFDGTHSAQTTTTPAAIAANTAWSIEGWMGFGSLSSSQQNTLLATTNGSSTPGFEIGVDASNNLLAALIGNAGGVLYISVANPMAVNTRYLVTVTYDGSGHAAGLKLYVNNALQSTTIGADTLGSQNITSSYPLTVAANPISATLGAVGNQSVCVLDHVIVYPYARTLSEVQTRYASGV